MQDFRDRFAERQPTAAWLYNHNGWLVTISPMNLDGTHTLTVAAEGVHISKRLSPTTINDQVPPLLAMLFNLGG